MDSLPTAAEKIAATSQTHPIYLDLAAVKVANATKSPVHISPGELGFGREQEIPADVFDAIAAALLNKGYRVFHTGTFSAAPRRILVQGIMVAWGPRAGIDNLY